jgi:hypothetical protein
MTFPKIDRALALRQLALLGYSESDNVYLRFFYPSNDPRKDTDKGRKSDRLDWLQIEAYQRSGRGAYFVINGGGHKNEDVPVGRAIFIEHDNLDKVIQRELWKTLGLPEPTFQVDTGGKSIHSYWVFDQPLSIEKWCSLQRDLLELADGDRSIKNPARVMRLAGAWHISFDEEGNPVYNQSLITSESGKVYTYEELRAAIPFSQAENSLPSIKRAEPSKELLESQAPISSDHLPRHPEEIQIPVGASVPLECCLSKESRYLIEHGVAMGGRNTNGAKLARDLIGTHNYLLAIGQSVDGDPRQMLDDYASRCNPPLEAREVETIWESAHQSNPTPSCGSEGVNNCIKGWYWREHLRRQMAPDRGQKKEGEGQNGEVTGFAHCSSKKRSARGSKSARNLETVLNRDLTLAWQIDEILDRHLSEWEQDLALVELAKSLDNYNASEIRHVASKRIEERHRQDNLEERRDDLERLERLESEEYLPFDDLFYDHPQVVRAFEHLCRVNQKIARRLEGTTRYLTVRMVQQARNPLLKGLNSEGIKKIFQDLAAMGKAKLTNWKRSLALVIDSMGGNNPTRGQDEPGGGNPSSTTHPVLLKSVGDLLENLDKPQTSLGNGLNSFVGNVESVGRCFSNPPTLCENLPTFATLPTIAQPYPPTGFEIVSTNPTNFQQNQEEEKSNSIHPEVQWLLELLADMEQANLSRFPNTEALDVVLSQAEQKAALCLDQLNQVCRDYWERVGLAWGTLASALSGNSSEEVQPTLAELKALLLAAQTLTDLRALKKKYPDRVRLAYHALCQEQQLLVDGLAASLVPHEVFKYTGPTLLRDGQKLVKDALVYLDPSSSKRSKSPHVKVWWLKGVSSGWNKAIEVSRDCLVAVKKAVAPVVEIVQGEQGMLFEL